MKRIALILALLMLPALAAADTQVASDNFTRANGAIGSNWNDYSTGWAISSNKAVNSTVPNGFNPATWSANSFSNDQYSTVTVAAWSTAMKFGAAVRVQSSGASGYVAYCGANSGTSCTSVYLYKVVSNSYSGYLGSVTVTIAPTDTLTLRISGSTLSILKNGSQTGSTFTDTTYTTGNPGIFVDVNGLGAANGFTSWAGGNAVTSTAYTRAASDSASASDAASVGRAVRANPSLTIADSITTSHQASVAASETLSVSEYFSGGHSLLGSLNEALQANATSSQIVNFADHGSADAASVADSVTAAKVTHQASASVADNAAISDSAAALASRVRILADSASSSDAVARLRITGMVSLADGLTISAQSGGPASHFLFITESLAAVDAALANQSSPAGSHYAATPQESVASLESMFPVANIGRTGSPDGLTVDDAAAAQKVTGIRNNQMTLADASYTADAVAVMVSHKTKKVMIVQ